MLKSEIKEGVIYTDGLNKREVIQINRDGIHGTVKYKFTKKGVQLGRGKEGRVYRCVLQTFASWAKAVSSPEDVSESGAGQ